MISKHSVNTWLKFTLTRRGLTKLSELVSYPFVFVYTIKYVQFQFTSNLFKKNGEGGG